MTNTDDRLDEHADLETDLLDLLYKAYPQSVWMNTAHPSGGDPRLRPLRETHKGYFSRDIHEVLRRLDEIGLVARSGDGSAVTIRPEGIRELSRRRGMATHEDLENTHRIALDVAAKIAEVSESVQSQQERLDSRIAEVETRAVSIERDFYSRIMPFFAAFIGAFALIVTGSQNAVRLTSLTGGAEVTDPAHLFMQTLAVMAPITVLVMTIVAVTWTLARWQPGGFWQTARQATAIMVPIFMSTALLIALMWWLQRYL